MGPKIIQDTPKKVAFIRQQMAAAHIQQKSYADNHRQLLEFVVGDQVFLKISPMKGMTRFGKKGKLISRFIGPFVISQRVGKLAYLVV